MQVENLGKLERRLQITVPVAEIEREVDTRLKRLSRTVRMPGFRPGKVPMKIVSQQYGFQVHNEVLNEKVGGAFSKAVSDNQLRVAGSPNITAKESGGNEGSVSFDATFEVYPDVAMKPLADAEVEQAVTQVDDAAVEKTIEILRRQRSHFHSKAPHARTPPAPAPAAPRRAPRTPPPAATAAPANKDCTRRSRTPPPPPPATAPAPAPRA